MRVYCAPFTAVAVTAQQDLFEVLSGTNNTTEIIAIEIEQSTEVGDAQEEGLSLLVKRGVGAVTSGSGGSTLSVQPIDDGDAAFSGVVEGNNTTKMATGSGSIEQLAAWNWNERLPFNKILPPEMRPTINGGDRLTLELATTPADSITMSGTIWLGERG